MMQNVLQCLLHVLQCLLLGGGASGVVRLSGSVCEEGD